MTDLRAVIDRFAKPLAVQRKLSTHQYKVLRDLLACRTDALGGHANTCLGCGNLSIAYNSCRNRHCPLCQSFKREVWQMDRMADLLNIHYFHLVFTVPEQLNPLIYCNQNLLYGLLFSSAAAALQQLAKNPKRLGAQLGLTGILHTWGQTLSYHPHVHFIVPGGGWCEKTQRFIPSKKKYLFPVKVISKVFRAIFLRDLAMLVSQGKIINGKSGEAVQKKVLKPLFDELYQKNFVVFAKESLASPVNVVKYLCQYTHRVAISNHRIVDSTDTHVSFRYKDYADHNKSKIMTLEGTEFLRRFLMHVLPPRFVKIRYFGFFAGRNRPTKLAKIQKMMHLVPSKRSSMFKTVELLNHLLGFNPLICKVCNHSGIKILQHFVPLRC
jgi:hypothetical protein